MPISEFCNPDVVCCNAQTTIFDVAKLMRKNHVGDVVVIGEGEQSRIPLGIITDRDIVIEAVAPEVDLHLLTAGDIMSTPLKTINESEGFFETIRYMREHKVRRLPVTRDDGTLFGIVVLDDIVSLLSVELLTVTRVMTRQPVIEGEARP